MTPTRYKRHSFDTSRPLDEQARAALAALADWDSALAKAWEEILVLFTTDGGEVPGAYEISEFAPSHKDAESTVTRENVAEVIVAGCKHWLWDSREAQLLALRRGFSTCPFISKDPVDLRMQLLPFQTPDLVLLVQGQVV